MPWVYLLHFDSAIAHAEHYAGATNNLRARLARHARGHGSVLCRELKERGIHWQLSAVWLTESPFEDELKMKGQKSARRFCPLCTSNTARLSDAMPVDPELLGIPLRSEGYL